MRNQPIVIGEDQMSRLQAVLGPRDHGGRDRHHMQELREELERAVVLSSEDLPADVVTVGTRVRVRDVKSGERREMTLVYPEHADVDARRISVLAPLGTALLGYREGDEVEWVMPGGLTRLDIERVDRPVEHVSGP